MSVPGSKADLTAPKYDFRFTPKADSSRKSRQVPFVPLPEPCTAANSNSQCLDARRTESEDEVRTLRRAASVILPGEAERLAGFTNGLLSVLAALLRGLGEAHILPRGPLWIRRHFDCRLSNRPSSRTNRLAGEIVLSQRGVDRGKIRIEGCSETVDRCDNCKRNTRSDQAVFDGGSATFVDEEPRKNLLHVCAPALSGIYKQ
jgi:hypothetical protein